MVNDLGGSNNIVKFVDDPTTWEVIARNSPSHLPSTVADCENLASDNNIKLNPPKTKELRAFFSSQPVAFSPIVIDDQVVDIVSHTKLLGVVISNDQKWNLNID